MIRLLANLLRLAWWTLDDARRALRRKGLDYVVLPLAGPYPERPEPRRFPWNRLPWQQDAMSVEELNEILAHLAADPRVKGLVLPLRGLRVSIARMQSLRQAIQHFRRSGKRVVVYAVQLDTISYALATAADEIVVPEAAEIHVAGLLLEALFLKDTLALAGIAADIEAIAEYKTAGDIFRRAQMSDAQREMLNALLDSYDEWLVTTIASARGLTAEAVRAAIDAMPMTAAQAREVGLVDAVLYEDELQAHLRAAGAPIPWETARRWIRRPRRWDAGKRVGVVTIEGTIVLGPSRRVPLPLPIIGVQAGSESVAQALRAAERDRRVVAVVLHVESRGGSALASDLIAREVARLRRAKPVVVYLGDVAASGGYYVAADANAIVAQPGTLTGSIGILGGKFVTSGAVGLLRAGREVLARGAAASMYRDVAPFSDRERRRLRAQLSDGYERFLERVAYGRGKSRDEVELVARGRVWTGAQAQERGLLDALGDFQTAVARAKALAGVGAEGWMPLVTIRAGRPWLPPLAFAGGVTLRCMQEAVDAALQNRLLALCPWELHIRG